LFDGGVVFVGGAVVAGGVVAGGWLDTPLTLKLVMSVLIASWYWSKKKSGEKKSM
jgi:hypothetical protein